jgi:hypothetical protein
VGLSSTRAPLTRLPRVPALSPIVSFCACRSWSRQRVALILISTASASIPKPARKGVFCSH